MTPSQQIPISTCSTRRTVRPTARLHHPLPVGTGGPQPRDHRLGRTRAQTCPRSGFLRPSVHRIAHMGRPADGRSHDRADQAARQHVLRRRTGQGQPVCARNRGGVTLRSWLGMWSLRYAQTRAEPHLARIDCPALVINAEQDTGVYPSDAQRIYDALASKRQDAVLDRHRPLLHHAWGPQREGRHHREMDHQAVAIALEQPFESSSARTGNVVPNPPVIREGNSACPSQ